MKTPIELAQDLADQLNRQTFKAPVHVVYNPLNYAWDNHRTYLERYGTGTKKILFLGMNPGPWGMAQTGVPFGDPEAVRTTLGISGEVDVPAIEHPKRKIVGCDSPRKEVSGHRVWSWVNEYWGSVDAFSEHCTIMNYCPLAFLEEGGRNRTPDKLTRQERDRLFAVCDDTLRARVAHHQPEWVLGFGAFAETRANAALKGLGVSIGRILHPSPASPRANRGWPQEVAIDLEKMGIKLPGSQAGRSS